MNDLSGRLILPEDGAKILAAVSGGADSMCLLSLLIGCGRFTVAAAHFEHGIRGEESLRDCRFVEDYCREKGIPCFVEHADVPARAKELGLGLEETARRLRYDFLEQTAEREGFEWIATAHTADDNAETMLFHLARGTGLKGLCGIPPFRGRIVRPLLALTRDEIETYLLETGTPHVEDSSNAEDFCSRNRIRHTAVPALKEINGAFAAAALRSARLLRLDEDCLDSLAQAFIEQHSDGVSIPAGPLLSLHEAVSSRVIRKILPPGAEEKHVEDVLALCRGSERKQYALHGAVLRFERGRLFFASEEVPAIPETVIPIGETVRIEEAGLSVRAEIVPGGQEIHSPFKTYRVKCESIVGKLTVSSPRPGERYRPERRGCTKTLRSLFAEQKATEARRTLTPVFRDGSGIVLVPPFGRADRCVPERDEAVIAITIGYR